MKKTGILTFHRALNYGAVLQCYGLYKVLCNLGVECEVIDYRCRQMEAVYRPFSVGHCHGFAAKMKKCLKSFQLAKKRKKFAAFSSAYLPLTRPCTPKTVSEMKDVFDYLVTGSDQVFNMDVTGEDYAYFLDFAGPDIKRIAYGASFGTREVPAKYQERIQNCLKTFEALSVREKSTATIGEKLSGKKVEAVLDPTLLLDREVWCKIAKQPKGLPSKYILVYMMEGCSYGIEKARQLAKAYDCDLVLINPTLKQQVTCRDFVLYPTVSPEEFLGIFLSAQAVVTNSFHGVAFSLIFEKAFYAEASNEEKAVRMTDLLEILELSNRLLPNASSSEIDWDKTRQLLAAQREQSIRWLRGAM